MYLHSKIGIVRSLRTTKEIHRNIRETLKGLNGARASFSLLDCLNVRIIISDTPQ